MQKKIPDIRIKPKLGGLDKLTPAFNNLSEKRIASSKIQDRRPSRQFRELHDIKTPDNVRSEMSTIKILWEQLGVMDNYRQIFENIISDLDVTIRKDFLEFEVNSLNKFHEQLTVIIL
jgi:hypothetical protein